MFKKYKVKTKHYITYSPNDDETDETVVPVEEMVEFVVEASDVKQAEAEANDYMLNNYGQEAYSIDTDITEVPKDIGYYIDNVIMRQGHSWDIAEAIYLKGGAEVKKEKIKQLLNVKLADPKEGKGIIDYLMSNAPKLKDIKIQYDKVAREEVIKALKDYK